jgi:hypothetical protein
MREIDKLPAPLHNTGTAEADVLHESLNLGAEG